MNYHAAKAYILDRLEYELSDKLTYHGLHHTLDVFYTAEYLCRTERLSPYETLLVKTAALFHDSGFMISTKNHEARGCEIVRTILPGYGYTTGEIDLICGMIMATKVPQQPQTRLEAILCDADLDYLGRDDFYEIGATLFEELKAHDVMQQEEAWNKLQVNFLEQHCFFTPTNKGRRSDKKHRHLNELKKIISNYEKISPDRQR